MSEPTSLLSGQVAQASQHDASAEASARRAVSIRRAVLAVALAAASLLVFNASGVNAHWPTADWLLLHGLIETLIIVVSAHIVSISFGLWFTQRNPRWLVLSAGFALVTLFNLGHLLFYSGLVLADPERVTSLFIWAHEHMACVVLFAAAFVVSARPLRRDRAAAVIALLVLYATVLLAFGDTAQRLVESSWHARGNNFVNILLCLFALLRVGMRVAEGDRTAGLVTLGTVIGLEMLAQIAYVATGHVTDAFTSLGHLYKLAAFGVLYVGLFFANFLRPYKLIDKTGSLFRTLVERSPAGIVLSRAGRIIHANPAFLQMFGFPDLEAAKQVRLWELEGEDLQEGERTHLARERGDAQQPVPLVRRAIRYNGEMIHVRFEHELVDMPDGRATLGYFVDLSETVNAQKELQRMANYDPLTALPNRTMLRDRLDQAVRVAQRAGDQVAVLFIDLDQFKEVNDTLGHATGDELLKMVADRLKDACRKEDTIGRLGGDEFLVIAQRLSSGREGAGMLAQKLISALDTPFDLEGHEVYVGGSIGISVFPRDAQDAAGMIKNADVAMYQAKRGGGPRACFYSEEMNARAIERLELGTELRRALERDEFELFYQPKVDFESGRICGAEALLRWRNPARGLVPPAQFVPILEETGLIVAVGRKVLAKACHQAMEWRTAGFGRIPVAVNLSAAQLRGGQLAEEVELSLQASGLPYEDLELEITESVLLHDYEQARAQLDKLIAKGVRASLDDFGTGYSSLSSLHNLPVQSVKIDRSFTQGLRPGRNTIVAAIVNVAHTLGMRVVAEGVETENQRETLRELGCNEMQGYLIAPPMPNGEFHDWLKAHRSRHLVAVPNEGAGTGKDGGAKGR